MWIPGTILFSVHAADRTGPPIVLLHFLRWLKANRDVHFEIVVWRGGPLLPAFRELAPVHDVEALGEQELGRRLAGLEGVRAVYVNCVAARRVLDHLPDPAPTVVTFVHELALQFHHLDADGGTLRRGTDHWIAGAGAIRDQLVEHGVPGDRIGLQYEFIEVPPAVAPERVDELRRCLDLPPAARVVGGCGVLEWRKGPDLFVQMALEVAPHLREAHFVWVGGGDGGLTARLARDVDAAGLGGRVHFVGPQDDVDPWFGLFDVFALTSREDAFPLVCLQAAAAVTPIVCFDTGGMPEFVHPEAGFVVGFPDVGAMAAHVRALLVDGVLRARLGEGARSRVRREHAVGAGAPALFDELRRAAGW